MSSFKSRHAKARLSLFFSSEPPLRVVAEQSIRHRFQKVVWLRVPPPTERTLPKEIWVSRLLSASADGTFLYAITGSRPRPEPTTGYSIDYSLCRMVVATGEIEVVKLLETPFA